MMLAVDGTVTALLLGGIAALITALTGAVALLVSIRRGVGKVHVLVNSQMASMRKQLKGVTRKLGKVNRRVSQLEQTLTKAGIEIPVDPDQSPGGTP